ncbi:MAG: START domain-containing protein [Mucilaginibacter sp.]
MIKGLQLLIILTSLSFACLAQEQWQLIKNEDGIKVYSRRLDNEKFKEVRADFDLKGTEEQLITLIQNIPHQHDWSYATKRSYVINKKNKDTLIYYTEVALPWPLTNRDVVVELSFRRDTLNKALFIQAKSIAGILPDKPNLVRVPFSLALWDVSILPNKLLRVKYTLSTNPGGALPAWLVNFAASTGPYNSFQKLKYLIKKENQ